MNNILQRYREKKFGKATIDYGELETWFNECDSVPEDEHDAYIVDHVIHIDDKDPKKNYFRFTCSTKHLIAKAIKSDIFSVVNTYKIVYLGFPLGVHGVVDKQKQLHPTMFSMCTNETYKDSEFIYRSLKVI